MKIHGYEAEQNNLAFTVIGLTIRNNNSSIYKYFSNSLCKLTPTVIKIEKFGNFLYDINKLINL